VARIADEAGPHGIPEHVEHRLAQLALGPDRLAAEARLEEMARASVPEVEPLRVDAVQPLDAAGQTRLADLDDQVDVGAHLHCAVDAPASAERGVVEQPVVRLAIVVVEEDLPTVDAPRPDVVAAVGIEGAKRPGHRRRR
jgi:hypothetical protein